MTSTSSCLTGTAGETDFCLTAEGHPASPVVLSRASDRPEIVQIGGERLGDITFERGLEGDWSAQAKRQFGADFCREITRLRQWAADHSWPVPLIDNFHVVISDRYRISRSLVPAWSGLVGHMEFPAWRVAARKAAIAHELVHVFFPNGNRLLAEGLAVCLQAEVGGNPAFPNFGRPLHDLVRELLPEMAPGFSRGDPASLGALQLMELDMIATPHPLTLRVGDVFYGEEPRGQTHIYSIAGSFVQFLIETYGFDMFRELYSRTSLVPLQHNGGRPDRWTQVYGMSLAVIGRQWKSFVAS